MVAFDQVLSWFYQLGMEFGEASLSSFIITNFNQALSAGCYIIGATQEFGEVFSYSMKFEKSHESFIFKGNVSVLHYQEIATASTRFRHEQNAF